MDKIILEKLNEKQNLLDRVSIPFRVTFDSEKKMVKKNVLTYNELKQIVDIADEQFTKFRCYNFQKEGFEMLVDGYDVNISFKQYGILRFIYDEVSSKINRLDYEICHYQKSKTESEPEME